MLLFVRMLYRKSERFILLQPIDVCYLSFFFFGKVTRHSKNIKKSLNLASIILFVFSLRFVYISSKYVFLEKRHQS